MAEWDARAADGDLTLLTADCARHAERVASEWWAMADRLIAKYSDGYVNPPESLPQNAAAVPIGYPSAWLGLTNYRQGPTTYDMRFGDGSGRRRLRSTLWQLRRWANAT